MLTDYHLHLRPDEDGTAAERYFTAENVDRYLAAAAAAGIEELGVSEHVYRFRQALDLWRHPLWVENARDDLDAYCEFVRATPLKLGIECDFVPGAEERTATLLEARDFDYVVGSVHFIGEGDAAVDHDGWDVWEGGGDPDEVWRRYFEALAELRPLRPLRHPRPPRPGQGLGPAPGRCPSATCAPSTSRRSRRSPRAGSRSRSRPPACASRSASSTRRRGFAEMCVEAGAPFALSSDAHLPEQVGFDYDRAVEFLDELGVEEICVFERRRAAAWRRSAAGSAEMVGIGYDSHRFAAGRPLILGGVEIEHELGPRAATPTPTSSPTR